MSYLNHKFLNQAESILNNSEDKVDSFKEFNKRKNIIAMCLRYKLKYQFINGIAFIYSLMDTWYFRYDRGTIDLYHKNNLGDIDDYHFQGKFYNIIEVIKYINKHDKFCYKPKKKKVLPCENKKK